jgi:hypothetical protein
MAARGIRDSRMMGRPGVQVARGPKLGHPVMTHNPMVRPVAPVGLRQPVMPQVAPVSAPAGMPAGLQGPVPVNPAGPTNIQPIAPGAMKL